ncbi:hypothetical protein KFZ76_20715 [Methylovulum psychrotolerans]|uniref:hypothetical protein n=1 Tax=Methylovulum psychrotolerans TaxID=1704499 RepID=UPI001BFEF1FA|nr:hypothetical protein [Methylovulum psychrotolerans]MBT9100130.1 hypothetical protein [Methylovulum psychrotolerans]
MEKVFSQHFSEADYVSLSTAVSTAYKIVEYWYKVNPSFSNTPTGHDLRPLLINFFVGDQLMKINSPGFSHEFQKNAARNCSHVRLYKGYATITAHFLGGNRTRNRPRSAIYRALLSASNHDIFESDEGDLEYSNQHLYCHLCYAGLTKAKFIILAIPHHSQENIIGKSLVLPNIEANQEKVEDIIEQLDVRVRGLFDEKPSHRAEPTTEIEEIVEKLDFGIRGINNEGQNNKEKGC